jgi:cbb3-type cytochrome oxidase maturation protein
MYSLYWFVLLIISVCAGLAAFAWGLRSGQFSDQARARFLPLSEDVHLGAASRPPRPTAQIYAFRVVAAIGLAVLASPLALVLYRHLAGG